MIFNLKDLAHHTSLILTIMHWYSLIEHSPITVSALIFEGWNFHEFRGTASNLWKYNREHYKMTSRSILEFLSLQKILAMPIPVCDWSWFQQCKYKVAGSRPPWGKSLEYRRFPIMQQNKDPPVSYIYTNKTVEHPHNFATLNNRYSKTEDCVH